MGVKGKASRLRSAAWMRWWRRWTEHNRIDPDAAFVHDDVASAFRAGFRAGWVSRGTATKETQ